MEAATKLPNSIRVLIADDHRLFAQALEAILAADDRIEVAGHARDGREAAELARSLHPDVILMDIAMPAMDGFQATRVIRKQNPSACILMLTGSNSLCSTNSTPIAADRAQMSQCLYVELKIASAVKMSRSASEPPRRCRVRGPNSIGQPRWPQLHPAFSERQ